MGRKYARTSTGRFAFTGGRRRKGGGKAKRGSKVKAGTASKVSLSHGKGRGFTPITNPIIGGHIAARRGATSAGLGKKTRFVSLKEASSGGRRGTRKSLRGASNVSTGSSGLSAPKGYIVST